MRPIDRPPQPANHLHVQAAAAAPACKSPAFGRAVWRRRRGSAIMRVMDVPAGAAPQNVPEFTVGEISNALQRTVEQAFSRVRVRGEVSGFKRAPSGHLYFTLKDA